MTKLTLSLALLALGLLAPPELAAQRNNRRTSTADDSRHQSSSASRGTSSRSNSRSGRTSSSSDRDHPRGSASRGTSSRSNSRSASRGSSSASERKDHSRGQRYSRSHSSGGRRHGSSSAEHARYASSKRHTVSYSRRHSYGKYRRRRVYVKGYHYRNPHGERVYVKGHYRTGWTLVSPRPRISVRIYASSSFHTALDRIAAARYERTRVSIARRMVRNHYLSSSQVRDILYVFRYESSRLDFAQYAYRYVADPWNFYLTYDAFRFESSIDELDAYLRHYAH